MTVAGILLAAVLLLFLTWKEYQRPLRVHRWWRILASAAAVAALGCLVWPPTYTSRQAARNDGAILIVTPGYDADSLAAYRHLPAFTTSRALSSAAMPHIPHLPQYLSQQAGISEVHVMGNGLDAAVLQAVSALPVNWHYHPAALPAGFRSAAWPRTLRLGEPLEVQGQYHNALGDTVRLVLTGLGTRFDSIALPPHSTQTFSLHSQPANTGHLLYALECFAGNRQVTAEKLPVQVLPAQPLQVLLLGAAPGFDAKFLLSYLQDHRYAVAARFAISRNKYTRQFINRAALPLGALSPALLNQFDVVVTDNQELAGLSPGDKAVLRTAVQHGLGLVLQTDSTVLNGPFTTGWQLRRLTGIPNGPQPLQLPAVNGFTAALEPGQWLSIHPTGLLQPLVRGPQDAVLTAASLYGAGKVVVNTVNNTYSWVLNGQRADYARFWSLLLQQAARPVSQAITWETITSFPTVDSPVEVTMESNRPGMPAIETPDGQLAASQQLYHPQTWTATWWPVHAGWQVLRERTDSTGVYIFDAEDWKTIKAMQMIQANAVYSTAKPKPALAEQASSTPARQTMPPLVFVVVFLVSSTYLWWEARKQYS